MNWWTWSLVVLGWWLVISCVYTYMHIGDKHRKAPWYDVILGLPLYLIIMALCAPRDLKLWWMYEVKSSRVYHLRGRVANITFTYGQGGHQLTTIAIGGRKVEFITYWNALYKDWEVGQMVEFDMRWKVAHLYGGTTAVLKHAENIRAART